MKRKIIILLISIFTIFVVDCSKKTNEKQKQEFSYTPLIYKICDEDSCIHLFGSIHVGDDRLTKFNHIVTDIYNKSDYLAVEVDTTDIVPDEELFLLSDDQTIDDLVNDELKEKLTNFSSKHFLFPYENIKTFSLGYIQNYISLMPAMELGLLSGGVDEHFLKLAHKDNKQIISLETYESQLAFLTDYSDDFYIKQLQYVIDNYDEQKELTKKLYEAYLTGSKEKIEEILEEDTQDTLNTSEEEEKYNQAILYDRNKAMTEKAVTFLSENKDVLIIVGEAHVLGEEGIIDLLKDKNYKINIIK